MDKTDSIINQVLIAGSLAVSYFYGGWSSLLALLLALVIIDYLTGIAAAAKDRQLKSSIGFQGIARKVLIFTMVAIAHMVDVTLGNGNLFRDATIFFYLANELISIIENAGRLGLPVPDVMKKAVELFQAKDGVSK